jgi:polyhydroxyalkanoate synthesis regulator phasin
MNKLDAIYEELNNRIARGELSLEDGQKVYNLACEKYADTEKDGSQTLESAIKEVKDYLENVNLSEDVVKAKRLLEAPDKHTNENAPKDVANNNAHSKRELVKASDDIKTDMGKAEGIDESAMNDLEEELGELRARVYEAYIDGKITLETAQKFSEDLDLDNYTLQ